MRVTSLKLKGAGEPTPQRFPVIIQAGTSSRGKEFAAEKAELIYVDSTDLNSTGENIKRIKELASTKFGRDPNSIKFIIHALPILGKTHEEALQKQMEISRASIPESLEIGLSCITGFDLGEYELDDPLDIIVKKTSNAIQGVTQGIINRALEDERQKKKQKRIPSKREFLETYTSKSSSLVGTPEEVAVIIESWVDNYDIDGINFGLHMFPDSANDLVDLLVPELQKRGLFWKDYAVPGGTFRDNNNAKRGATFVPATHPAHKFRWTPDHTKEQFDAKFEEDYLQIKSKRTL
jgi:alkanesulfonate monooxygenase SsuD/methylene tetrahydromethanopterin reductase-like flavin-dependent oxidoreductase (luciferase family)